MLIVLLLAESVLPLLLSLLNSGQALLSVGERIPRPTPVAILSLTGISTSTYFAPNKLLVFLLYIGNKAHQFYEATFTASCSGC